MIRKMFNLFRARNASADKLVDGALPIPAKKPTVTGPIKRGRPIRNLPAPPMPGIYTIKDKETGERKYIGVSRNLKKRLAAHKRGKFDPDKHDFLHQLANETATSAEIYGHETKKIKKHKPPLNQNKGGGGRPWKRDPTKT